MPALSSTLQPVSFITTNITAVISNTTSPWPDLTTTITTDVISNLTSPRPDVSGASTEALRPPAGCLVMAASAELPWNNPEDLVSRETQQDVNRFVNVYMLTVLFFVSTPTNIINMIIFWRQGLKERINLCLFCLAFADFVTVFTHFEWNLDGLYSELTGEPYKLVVMKYNVNYMIHSLAGFIYISGFLSMLIAFERCLCIVFPLKAHTIMRTKTTLIIIIAAHVMIMAGHFVITTRWRVKCMFDPATGQTVDAFYSSWFYLHNKSLVDLFDGIIFGLLLPGMYVTGVLVSTVITVVKLREMAKWRDHSSTLGTVRGMDVAVTRMLIGTSMLYIACTTPPLVFHATIPIVPELSLSGKYYNTYYMFINLQQFFTYINASVNFFVYFAFGTKFRNGVKKLLLKCRVRGGRYVKDSSMPQTTALYSISHSHSNASPAYSDTTH